MISLNEKLENVAIIGAAGKMGSGISFLLAYEMAILKVKENVPCKLQLIDTREEALDGLCSYINKQALKKAEKSMVFLRSIYSDYKDIVENKEIIDHFVATINSIMRPTTVLDVAKNSKLVFEAVIEKESLKIDIFKQLKSLCGPDTLYFTNTSSIPVKNLDNAAQLEGKIIGYHFYNPPAVQKLLELIKIDSNTPEQIEFSEKLAKQLGKIVIVSNDIAGFIGNGHFIREGIRVASKVKSLQEKYNHAQSVYMVNKVTQDLMVRPMGMFQLIDYVGLDVFNCIMTVMGAHIEGEEFASDLITDMCSAGVLGGQNSDGSQKDGFFRYEKGKIVGVYDLSSKEYLTIEEGWTKQCDEDLGTYPANWYPWKKLLKDREKQQKVSAFFESLQENTSLGAKLALEILRESKDIATKLVQDGVAEKNEDVDEVLLTGFFHVYGITQLQLQ